MSRANLYLVEPSEEVVTKTNTTDTATGRVHESASQIRERLADQFQPGGYYDPRNSIISGWLEIWYYVGDTRATSRRLSDTPNSIRQFREDGAREVPDHGIENNKTVLQSAQETVAKALGGGSRGECLGRWFGILLMKFSRCKLEKFDPEGSPIIKLVLLHPHEKIDCIGFFLPRMQHSGA